MKKVNYLRIGFILMAISIALGALAAHALEKSLEAKYLAVFYTGNKYFSIHALALILLSSVEKLSHLNWCRHFLFVGIIFFCGNCFLYSFTGIKVFAMLVPIGGFSFIIGWILGFIELRKIK